MTGPLDEFELASRLSYFLWSSMPDGELSREAREGALGPTSAGDDRRLEAATLVVHGHAHRGAPEGRTGGGVPVYNVSAPLLHAHFPDRPAFRVFEIDAAPTRPPEGPDAGPS